MSKQYQVRNGSLTDITPKVAAIVGRNVGELVHSIVPLVDANLHLLDGTELQDDGIYADGIAKIKALQASYPGLFTTEADWQASVTQYGVCGKFVIGTGTLRLPKLAKSFIEATIDATALGDLVEAGLPNLSFIKTVYDGSGSSGYMGSQTQHTFGVAGNASAQNAIYGNSTTVQPQSIKGFIYIVLGTFPKSSAVVNLDNIATDLNGKADVDITNLTNAGKAALAHAAMPSDTAQESLTLPTVAGQEYTMPADGYLHFTVTITGAGRIYLYKDGIILASTYFPAVTGSQTAAVSTPVSAGSKVKVAYNNATPGSLVLIYCNGNAHLAS